MNILLTNDDGYFAEGIKLLREKLQKFGRVVIVAPQEVMSAKSCSIIIGHQVSVEKVEEDVYKMEGTPADCVAFGLSSLNIRFDLVVAGCNDGFNISYDIMYSGTVGACLQAMTYHKPAIAVSCDVGDLTIVDDNFEKVFQYIIENNLLSFDYALNVNFPKGDEIKEYVLTSIYYRHETTYYVDCGNGKYYAYREINDKDCNEPGTDVYAVYHGQLSITKISKTSLYKED